MRSVRSTHTGKFRATVDQMIHANEFARGECVVSTIAKGVARSFGLSPDVVEMVPMHNNWTSADFMHTVLIYCVFGTLYVCSCIGWEIA
ncbi:hypothetical protein F2Q70_00021295 [Brassica cretica]|uniref:Uncharacterized protein n=1 Tax=Brassica cretica TaxID=69181 RepID=A0A8S9GN69_BRACR|nr:hypothetical protein F2Q70_00021295 [Brassica cretica]KAF3610291.1 hypothetical protein DY000_02047480 [Brassica cretica]